MAKLKDYFLGPQILCMGHFVHLIISKVLHCNNISEHIHKEIQCIEENYIQGEGEISEEDYSDPDSYTEASEGQDIDSTVSEEISEETKLNQYAEVINRIRRILRTINRSPKKKEEFEGSVLKLDVVTR